MRKGSKFSRAQSAMEYLMTYGWAILIIAVVLGTLFQLGVFNSSSFAPRAPPGACQVFRPSGPRTTTNINLMGVCTGQLPQYVGVFNGQTSYVSAPDTRGIYDFTTIFTMTAWIKPVALLTGVSTDIVAKNSNSGTRAYEWYLVSDTGSINSAFAQIFVNGNNCQRNGQTRNYNQWSFLSVTYSASAGQLILYYNGAQDGTVLSCSQTLATNANPLQIGAYLANFNGIIANVQIYNTSLSANEIQALYLGGMGAPPLLLQYLVGWWPLNGNPNDYSGNNNNGVPTAVTFTSQYGK